MLVKKFTFKETEMINFLKDATFACLVFFAGYYIIGSARAENCMAEFGVELASNPQPMAGYTKAMAALEACKRGVVIIKPEPQPPVVSHPRLLQNPQPRQQVCQVFNGDLICSTY